MVGEPSCALARVPGIGHSIAMGAASRRGKEARLMVPGLVVLPGPLHRARRQPGSRVRLAELRQRTLCEQVAAVCYRVRRGEIEFLLVRTRGRGRWTFPKGSAEPGLTQAQAAALEAFEEAGVHGRIEESSFARYRGRKSAGNSGVRRSQDRAVIHAFLCEVTRLCAPQEARRDRTWFSAPEAKLRLREDREAHEAAGFTRVVDQAVLRVQRLRTAAADAVRSNRSENAEAVSRQDALRRVQFEAFEHGYPRVQPASRTRLASTRSAHKDFSRANGQVLLFPPPKSKKPPSNPRTSS